jgi:hypothetical protein
MARFKWFNEDSKITRSEEGFGHALNGKHAAAVVASLLVIATFAAVGCSKSKQPPQDSSKISTPVVSSPATVVAPALPSTPATTEKASPKKVVKKRSSTVTYKNVASGVSFQYPRKYTLRTGEDAKLEWNGLGPIPMNFVQPGGVTVAAVELPRSSYSGTDFASAFFNVSMHRSLSSDECSKFALTDAVHPDQPADPTKVKIGDKEFDQVEDFGGEAIKQADAKYYHLYENGACYEFMLGLGTAGYGIEEGIEPFDRSEVFSKLEKILATVKLQPVVQKEVIIGRVDDPASKEAGAGSSVDSLGKPAVEKKADSINKEVSVEKKDTTNKDVVAGKSTQAGETSQK